MTARTTIAAKLLSALVAASVLGALVVDLGTPGQLTRVVLEQLMRGNFDDWHLFMRWGRDIDAEFREGPDSDVYLYFDGFRADSEGDAIFVLHRYIRSRYAAHPRRVLVGLEDRPLRQAPELLAGNEEPTLDWLRARNVGVLVRHEKRGELYTTRTEHVPP